MSVIPCHTHRASPEFLSLADTEHLPVSWASVRGLWGRAAWISIAEFLFSGGGEGGIWRLGNTPVKCARWLSLPLGRIRQQSSETTPLLTYLSNHANAKAGFSRLNTAASSGKNYTWYLRVGALL